MFKNSSQIGVVQSLDVLTTALYQLCKVLVANDWIIHFQQSASGGFAMLRTH